MKRILILASMAATLAMPLPASANSCMASARKIERFAQQLERFAKKASSLSPDSACRQVNHFKIQLDGLRTDIRRQEAACGFPSDVRENLALARGFLNEAPCSPG
jgi:hypothetical protein